MVTNYHNYGTLTFSMNIIYYGKGQVIRIRGPNELYEEKKND